MFITKSFSKATSQTSKGFTIVYFRILLLDFIVNNNISFKAICDMREVGCTRKASDARDQVTCKH
jgi:hypothetical protein